MKRNFTAELLRWKDSKGRKPLLVKGLRQVGKTYSITEFGKKYFPKMHYLNFEQKPQLERIFAQDLEPRRIIAEISFVIDANIDINHDLLFLDEIQACPKALTSLKYFQEDMPQLAICAAGSLLGVTLAKEPFPVGKVTMLNVYPLSFSEFLEAVDTRAAEYLNAIKGLQTIPEVVHNKLWQLLLYYFVVGGLPEVVQIFRDNKQELFSAFELVRTKQNELVLAYNADMAKHSGKVNALHLDRIWKSIPAQLAREADAMAPKFKFKGVVPGVNRYSHLATAIDWLEAAGLIIKVPVANSGELPLAAYSKENSFKLFMADIGLLGAIGNLPASAILKYNYGTYKGFFAENYVAQELTATIGGNDLYSWQGNRAEVEFLCIINSNVVPIEVKSGWITRTKSLKIFVEKYRPKYSVVLSGQSMINVTDVNCRLPLYLASKLPTFCSL